MLQSQAFETVFHSDESLVYSAADGTFEIGFLGLLRCLAETDGKIVFLTNFQESAQILHEKLEILSKIQENRVLFDNNLALNLKKLAENRIIISSAENFEVLTRKWQRYKSLSEIKLLVADQLHLLGEP